MTTRTWILGGTLVILLLAVGTAVALPTVICRASAECQGSGRCTFVLDSFRCRVTSDGDCRSADRCRILGECTARDGQCVAAKPADCADSDFCKREGLCAPADGQCVASEEGCRSSAVCRDAGRCVADRLACREPRRENPRGRPAPR